MSDRITIVSYGPDLVRRALEIDMAQAELIVASNSSDPNDWGFEQDWVIDECSRIETGSIRVLSDGFSISVYGDSTSALPVGIGSPYVTEFVGPADEPVIPHKRGRFKRNKRRGF